MICRPLSRGGSRASIRGNRTELGLLRASPTHMRSRLRARSTRCRCSDALSLSPRRFPQTSMIVASAISARSGGSLWIAGRSGTGLLSSNFAFDPTARVISSATAGAGGGHEKSGQKTASAKTIEPQVETSHQQPNKASGGPTRLRSAGRGSRNVDLARRSAVHGGWLTTSLASMQRCASTGFSCDEKC